MYCSDTTIMALCARGSIQTGTTIACSDHQVDWVSIRKGEILSTNKHLNPAQTELDMKDQSKTVGKNSHTIKVSN